MRPLRAGLGLGLGFLVALGACNGAGRVPANHREAGAQCPSPRGPGISAVGTPCATSQLAACLQDADCKAGTNGRCLASGGPACLYGCSYDGCSQDADCGGNVPCACRTSGVDPTANTCATQSGCRTDADCGPGGFCSPSLVNRNCVCASESFCKPGDGACYANGVEVACQCSGDCGHGWFCHTPSDECVDDGDCPASKKSCSFDRGSRKWRCTSCLGPV